MNKEILAKRVKELRKLLGYTQIELVEKIQQLEGVGAFSQPALSRIERGQQYVDYTFIKIMHERFGVDPLYFFESSAPPHREKEVGKVAPKAPPTSDDLARELRILRSMVEKTYETIVAIKASRDESEQN